MSDVMPSQTPPSTSSSGVGGAMAGGDAPTLTPSSAAVQSLDGGIATWLSDKRVSGLWSRLALIMTEISNCWLASRVDKAFPATVWFVNAQASGIARL